MGKEFLVQFVSRALSPVEKTVDFGASGYR